MPSSHLPRHHPPAQITIITIDSKLPYTYNILNLIKLWFMTLDDNRQSQNIPQLGNGLGIH